MSSAQRGSTTLSDEQFQLALEGAAAGLGPAGMLAALETSGEFTPEEIQGLGGPSSAGNGSQGSNGSGGGSQGKGHGKKGKGGGGSGGGSGEGSWIDKLLPGVLRGDKSNQSSTTGTQYQPPTTLNPSLVGGSSPGGSDTGILLVGLAAVGVGAFFIFRKHKGEEHKK